MISSVHVYMSYFGTLTIIILLALNTGYSLFESYEFHQKKRSSKCFCNQPCSDEQWKNSSEVLKTTL
jgi:hypothetical protein